MMQRLIDDGEFEETINRPVEPDNGVRSNWRTRP